MPTPYLFKKHGGCTRHSRSTDYAIVEPLDAIPLTLHRLRSSKNAKKKHFLSLLGQCAEERS